MTESRAATSRLLDALRRKREARRRKAAERAHIRDQQRVGRDARGDLARRGTDSGGVGGNVSGGGA